MRSARGFAYQTSLSRPGTGIEAARSEGRRRAPGDRVRRTRPRRRLGAEEPLVDGQAHEAPSGTMLLDCAQRARPGRKSSGVRSLAERVAREQTFVSLRSHSQPPSSGSDRLGTAQRAGAARRDSQGLAKWYPGLGRREARIDAHRGSVGVASSRHAVGPRVDLESWRSRLEEPKEGHVQNHCVALRTSMAGSADQVKRKWPTSSDPSNSASPRTEPLSTSRRGERPVRAPRTTYTPSGTSSISKRSPCGRSGCSLASPCA